MRFDQCHPFVNKLPEVFTVETILIGNCKLGTYCCQDINHVFANSVENKCFLGKLCIKIYVVY